jgi:SAM-dependent methyltransferase
MYNRFKRLFGLSTVAFALAITFAVPGRAQQAAAPTKRPDVIFVATPTMVVDAMLEMAGVTEKDVVYDLGCGDGRIVVEAAKKYGARGVGIDIDPKRIEEAKARALEQGVVDRVSFRLEDLFEADFREATVVTLYLLTTLNERLRPRLWEQLKVGARVVSHSFDMGDWSPDEVAIVSGRPVYLWTITKDVKERLKTER